MDALTQNCCRTCLGSQSLYPIFHQRNRHKKYTNILLAATRQKITINDTLPLQMCSVCISFVNSVMKFWKRCQQTHVALLKLQNGGNILDIINETHDICPIDVDNFTQIDLDVSNLFITGDKERTDLDISNLFIMGDKERTDDENHVDCEDIKFDVNPESIFPSDYENDEFDHEDYICLNSLKLSKKIDALANKTELTEESKLNTINNAVEEDNKSTRNGITKHEDATKKKKDKSKVRKTKKDLENGHENKKEIEHKKENGVREKRKGKKKETEEVVCNVCNKVFLSKASLRGHNRVHNGLSVVCEHCGKKFISRHFLLSHCRAKHGYEKTDKCSFCEYRASNAEQVRIHERLHTGEKPFTCEVCGAAFYRRSTYLQHKAIHLPERTALCDRCPMRFKSITLMRIHASKHRPPKYLFRCHVCDNKFARPRNVLRHLLKLHNIVGTKDYYTREKI